MYWTVWDIPSLAGKQPEGMRAALMVGGKSSCWMIRNSPLAAPFLCGKQHSEQLSHWFENINLCTLPSLFCCLSSPSSWSMTNVDWWSRYHHRNPINLLIYLLYLLFFGVKLHHMLTRRHVMYVNVHSAPKCPEWSLVEQCLFFFFTLCVNFTGVKNATEEREKQTTTEQLCIIRRATHNAKAFKCKALHRKI